MTRLYGKIETFHKTVRLTQEQIDLIDSQGQDSFTANLNHLLNEFLPSGETERGRRIRIEQDVLRETSEKLDRLLEYLRVCHKYACSLGDALGDALDLEDLLRKDGTDLSVSHPWRKP